MSLRGRLTLIRWNYNALFSTISASKEYIDRYVRNERKTKVVRKAFFNTGLLLRELLAFRNQLLVTDFIYMHLPSFLETLRKQGVRGIDLRFMDPMNMSSKNLSFIFMMNFDSIKKTVEDFQKKGVLTSSPPKGSLLRLMNGIADENDISGMNGIVDDADRHPRPSAKLTKKQNDKLIKRESRDEAKVVGCRPSKLFIELTRNCNCSCIMCGREKPSYDEKFNMDLELFKRIADFFFPYADYVDLRGFGETTLIKNIDRYIDYALRFDCDFGMITNMTVKDDKLWEKLVLNNFWLGVSFDGAKKETYQKIRVHGNYDNVLRNFDLIKDISRKRRIKNRLYLIVTVQKDNIDEVPDIVRMAKKYGIGKVELSPVILPYENHPCGLIHVKEKVKPNIAAALKLGKELGVEVSLIGTFGLDEAEKAKGHRLMKRCPRPWSWLYINYDGKVGPCNHLMDPLFVLGDLSKSKGDFHRVLNNDSYQLMRSIIHTPFRYKSCEWCFRNRYDY